MPATQRNLLETGSGHLAGGMASANEVAEGLCSLNFTSATANNIMSLMQSSKNQNEARMKEMTDGTSPPSAEELKRRYAESKRMTSGTIFFEGDGILGTAVRDEVIQRNRAKETNEANKKEADKQKLRQLKQKVDEVRHRLETVPVERLTNKHLEILIGWKRQKGDEAMPKNKLDLLTRWSSTKGRASPHISPYNLDDESEEGGDDADGSGNNGEEGDQEEGEQDGESHGKDDGDEE